MSGTVQISNAGISFIDLPNGLSDINGTLTFNEDRLQVQTLTARTGGGVLNLGGFVSYSNGLFANLTAKGNDIRLRYPPGVSAVADTDLRFVGNTKNSTLSGEVTVTKFGLNPRFDFALYLARSNQPPTVPNPDSPNSRCKPRWRRFPAMPIFVCAARVPARWCWAESTWWRATYFSMRPNITSIAATSCFPIPCASSQC
jgi:translocation and assembly module TamB